MREKLELKIVVMVFLMLFVGVFIAASMTYKMEHDQISRSVRTRVVNTGRLVSTAVERTMVEADEDLTESLVSELKEVGGFGLVIYDDGYREAFKSHKTAEVSGDKALISAIATGEEVIVESGKGINAYIPLINLPRCQICHSKGVRVLGAVKVVISTEKEFQRLVGFAVFLGIGSIFGVIVIGTILWLALRRSMINPLKVLERAAQSMSEGDLTFGTEIKSRDEIGRLDNSIKDSLYTLSSILRRVQEVAERITDASDEVGMDSDKILEGTMLESEAVEEISSSLEQLNANIAEVAESTENMATSIQDTAASMEELANTISSIKETTHEVSSEVDNTSTSIEEMSATIKEVAGSAVHLGMVSEESLASVEEIIATVKDVESRAKESARLTHRVSEDATNLGVTSINETIQGMDRIKTSVTKAATVIERLGGRSEEIGNILNVINEITDQTTLLALNAAILAAQAGEHGKGFSVVAGEIKDLAERTALSTQEIDGLIRNVRQEVAEAVTSMDDGVEAVEEGMQLSNNAATALEKILESARQASAMSTAIERTTSEQVRTAQYVTEAIERMRQMVKDVERATKEQETGVRLIIEATDRIREASHRADSATEQQASGSHLISNAIDHISEMSQQISKSIHEQMTGSRQIWASVEKIKDIPSSNREIAFRISKALKELSRDSSLVDMEMKRFTLFESRDGSSLRMGVVPYDSPVELYSRFLPLVDYLKKETGLRIELKVASDYATAVNEIAHGDTDICFMTSLTYVRAHNIGQVAPLAQIMRMGKPTHQAAIITREHGTVRSLEDVKHRTLAFVDENSASGYLVPRAMLNESGVALSDLSEYKFKGTHSDVVRAVLAGEFEVGAVMASVLEKFEGQGIRVVELSDHIPEFAMCANLAIPEDVKASIKQAILKLTPDNKATGVLLPALDREYTGFAAASDESFANIRKYIEKAGL